MSERLTIHDVQKTAPPRHSGPSDSAYGVHGLSCCLVFSLSRGSRVVVTLTYVVFDVAGATRHGRPLTRRSCSSTWTCASSCSSTGRRRTVCTSTATWRSNRRRDRSRCLFCGSYRMTPHCCILRKHCCSV